MMESVFRQKLRYEYYSPIISNSPEMEITHLSLSSRMDEQITVYPRDGVLLDNEKGRILSMLLTDEP